MTGRVPSSALVTGATGFIGSALAHHLARQGARVTCPVRRGTSRLARLDAPGIVARPLDGFDEGTIRALIEETKPEVIFHLASYGVDPTERDPEAMTAGNVTLLETMLRAARGTSVRRVVFTGSCSEYGPAAEPTRLAEGHALAPQSPYGAAKLAAEVRGTELAATLGVSFVTLRLFGTYGPREAAERLVPYLVRHLRRGDVPDLTGGEQARDLMFVEDTAEAIAVAGSSEALVAGGAFNVCTGEPLRIRDVAHAVARLMGKAEADLGLGRRAYRPDEAMWIVGDPTRFHAATGFRPRIDREDGLRRSIRHALEEA